MPTYLCSIPNPGKQGRLYEILSDDPAKLERFARRWDVPGRAVYYAVNPLKPGAASRSLENVEHITTLAADLDFKDLAETPEEADVRLKTLPIGITEARNSGGGRHLIFNLNEPIEPGSDDFERACSLMPELARVLGGDPAPTKPHSLLRWPGSHNSKRGEPVEVTRLWGTGESVDLTEITDLIDLLSERPLFARKEARHSGNGTSAPRTGVPLDVGQRLAEMSFQGPGDTAIHTTQLRCTASLLRHDTPLEEAIETVLEATVNAAKGDPRTAGWNWALERLKIARMALSHVSKNPDLATVLPDSIYEPFLEISARGERPRLAYDRTRGAYLRGWPQANRKARLDPPDREKLPPPPRKRGKAPVLEIPSLTLQDPMRLPPREWLYGRHYARRTVSVTAAPGGFGKSSLQMVEAVAMTTGRDLLGEQPTARLKVWYHNGEDPLEELQRRLVAICQHYGVPQTELQGWLFLTSGNQFPLRVADGYGKLTLDTKLLTRLEEQIRATEIDAATFDPLVTLHSVQESDNTAMNVVLSAFRIVADNCDCAVELAHHTRKGAIGVVGDLGVDDMRGASSLRDAVRSARMLNRMTEEEADKAGITGHARASYFRVDRVKNNYDPPENATWRRIVNVELFNTDDVGVVEAWEFPAEGSPEMAERNKGADDVFLQTLDRFAREGRIVSDAPRGYYAPKIFAGEPEAKTLRLSKDILEAAMRRLFKAGRITLKERRSTSGHVQKYLAQT